MIRILLSILHDRNCFPIIGQVSKQNYMQQTLEECSRIHRIIRIRNHKLFAEVYSTTTQIIGILSYKLDLESEGRSKKQYGEIFLELEKLHIQGDFP